MQIAINDQNQRLFASKGQYAICPCCQSRVKAFCGETNVYHWRHINKADCDSWYEAESQWHITWKNEFPMDWREAVIKKETSIHRADVLTPNGFILELQNSPLSAEVIREREIFYQNMIWLINGTSFKGNIQTYSLLKQKSDEFERANWRFYSSNPEDYININYEKKELCEIVEKKTSFQEELEKLLRKQKVLSDILKDYKEATITYLKWFSYPSLHLSDFHYNNKDTFRKKTTEIETLRKQINGMFGTLHSINQIPKCEVNSYEDYIYLKQGQFLESNFKDYILIEKSSINQIFPSVIKAASEIDFSIKIKQGSYLVAINPTSKILKIKAEINSLEIQIDSLESDKNAIINDCENQLKQFVEIQLETTNLAIKTLKSLLAGVEQEEKGLQNEISKLVENQLKFGEERIDEHTKELEKEKAELVNKYSDIYIFNWKYRHRSWDNSNSRKFIDMGKYILEILDSSLVKRLSKEQFIMLVKNLTDQ